MDVAEFERLLNIGLGRAVLFLQKNDAAPYREVILNACLHNMALDRQVEGSRAEYMFEIIELAGEKAFYRDQIMAALANLPPDPDDYDLDQLLDFAGLFAAQGDHEARQALYDYFNAHVSSDYWGGGAKTIIRLDGIQGFCHVAARLGESALADPDFKDSDGLLEELEEQVGENLAAALVQQAQSEDPRIAAYVKVMLDYRADSGIRKPAQRPDPA